MADYDLTGIQLNVELTGEKEAAKDLDKLIKQLEKMGVKVNVGLDTEDVKKQAQEVKTKITQAMDSVKINPELNQQAFSDLYDRLRKVRSEVDELAKVDLFTDKDSYIQKAILTYQDGMGKVVTETMAWKEVLDEANSTLTKTFETQGFKYSDNIAKEQAELLKQENKTMSEKIEKEKTLIFLNEQRYSLNKQVSALMKDSSFRGTDEYKDMAEINAQIKAIKQSEGAIDKEQLTNLNRMISDLKIKLDIETKYLSQKDKEETIQDKINKQLREISVLKDNKFVSEDDMKLLSETENKLKKFKTNSTDANHELSKLSNTVKDVGLNAKALEKVSNENDKLESSANKARLKQESLYESVRKLKETKIAYDVEGLNNFVNQLDNVDINSEEAKQKLDELSKAFERLRNNANESSSKVNLVDDIKSQLSKLDSVTISNDKFDKAVYGSITGQYKALMQEIESGSISLAQAKDRFDKLTPSVKDFENASKQASDTTNSLSDRIHRYFQFNVVSDAVQLMKRGFREVVDNISQLDASLVELQKVSDLTASGLDEITDRAYAMGGALARTGKEVIDAVTTAKRAGYDMEESFQLGEQALVMTNVAENIKNVEEASSSLIGVLRGYGKDVSEVTHLVDAFNEVSNTQAVNFDDLVDGATRISGVMNQQGNSYEEMLGLLTGGTEILRDVEKVSTGIQTITMRLAGMNEEGDKLEPEVVSKMTDEFERLAGISLVDQNGQIKDTYDILASMAEVMPTLDRNTRQYLLELASGKRQANVLQAILTNWENVEKATDSATNSLGSSAKEMDKYINSIEGKTNQLKSSLQELSINFISSDTVKATIDLTNSIVELIDACGGLNTILTAVTASYIAFKIASKIDTTDGIINGINTLIKSMFTMKTATDAATISTTALSLAQKTLIAGGIFLGIMAIGGAIKYVSEESERAEKKIKELNNELTQARDNQRTANNLATQYEQLSKLSKEQALNNEQQSEFTRIQNDLAEIMPEINGYYDEQGNFIITETDLITKLNEVYKELIETKKQQKADAASGLVDNLKSQYESDMNTLENFQKKYDLYMKYKNGESLTDMESREISIATQNMPIDDLIANTQEQMNRLQSATQETSKKIKSSILDVVGVTEEWNGLSDIQSNAMRKFISEQDVSYFSDYIDEIKSGTFSVENFIESLLGEQGVLDNVNQGLLEQQKQLESTRKEWNLITKTEDDYKKSIDDLTKRSKSYTGILDELNEKHGLSSDTISNIAQNYPELLAYMDDEDTLRQKLIDSLSTQDTELQDAYDRMIAKNAEYYEERVIGDSDMYSKLTTMVEGYFNGMGVAYGHDLKEYQTLEQAKLESSKALIDQLAGAWKEYYYATSEGVGFDRARYLANATAMGLSPDQINEGMKAMNKAEYEAEKMVRKFDDILGKTKFNPLDLSAGNDKDKKSSKSDDPFKKSLDNIRKTREQLEQEIAILQEKMNLANVMGDTDLYNQYADKMTILLDKMRGLSSIEIGKLQDLKGTYKAQEQLAELESAIQEAREQGFIDERQYQEHMISLINTRYDLEKRAYDDKVKDLSLEQLRVGEGSERYKQIEEEKYNMLLQLQQSYLEKARQLQALGLSQNQEDVRKFIDLWKDAEEERLNMVKSRLEKERQLEIDAMKEKEQALKDQYDAKQKILDMTLDMLKQEEKARTDANKKQIKDEIDTMKKLADARKRELQRQKDEHYFNKDVNKRNDEISAIQAELNKLQFDNSEWAAAERARLEKELRDKQGELDDKFYDDKIDKQMDAIDEQVRLFEEQKEKELEIIEANQLTEVELRKKALELMDKDNKALYERLKKYNADYAKVSEFEFESLWDTANKGLEQYGITTKNTLDTMYEMQKVMKELAKQAEALGKAPLDLTKGLGGGTSGGTGGNTGSTGGGLSEKGKQQLNQKKYLDDMMAKAQRENNQGLIKWIEAERLRWGMDKSGKIIKQFHTGLDLGRVGDGIKPNEVIAKLTKDEWVITNKQMSNLTNNLKGMVNSKPQLPPIQVIYNGNVTKDAEPMLRDFENRLEKKIYKIVNESV